METIYDFDWHKDSQLSRLVITRIHPKTKPQVTLNAEQWELRNWQESDLEWAKLLVLECNFDIYYHTSEPWFQAEFFEYEGDNGETCYAWNALPGMIWRARIREI